MNKAIMLTALVFSLPFIADAQKPVVIQPRVVTDAVNWDTDDPAIWINATNPAASLILGTDKNRDGALYVFDLNGRIVNIATGLQRPNNVDVTYGFPFRGQNIDLAVVTERQQQRLRVFRLPDLTALDHGDLTVFDGDTARAPMGIALYKRPHDSACFVLVSGKSGPRQGYIGQYRLQEDEQQQLKITLVRQFGKFSGKKEIEAIAVDSELGYVYYSDETVGVRKYHADPDQPDADRELAILATRGFKRDHEGISIYKKEGSGYLIVSDQQANRFWIWSRQGPPDHPHEHRLLKTVSTAAIESDGNEVTSLALSPEFPAGLFVAMSNGKVFHYYAWQDMMAEEAAHHNN